MWYEKKYNRFELNRFGLGKKANVGRCVYGDGLISNIQRSRSDNKRTC
jgi:hypothetical protein